MAKDGCELYLENETSQERLNSFSFLGILAIDILQQEIHSICFLFHWNLELALQIHNFELEQFNRKIRLK